MISRHLGEDGVDALLEPGFEVGKQAADLGADHQFESIAQVVQRTSHALKRASCHHLVLGQPTQFEPQSPLLFTHGRLLGEHALDLLGNKLKGYVVGHRSLIARGLSWLDKTKLRRRARLFKEPS